MIYLSWGSGHNVLARWKIAQMCIISKNAAFLHTSVPWEITTSNPPAWLSPLCYIYNWSLLKCFSEQVALIPSQKKNLLLAFPQILRSIHLLQKQVWKDANINTGMFCYPTKLSIALVKCNVIYWMTFLKGFGRCCWTMFLYFICFKLDKIHITRSLSP